MEHWKSTTLATQVIALLTPEAQNLININKKAFQWIDPISDEIITDGCSLLSEVHKLMRPDVQMNIYAELAKIKTIKPANYGFNIVKWHSAMETNCISIKQKVPSAYHKSQYIMDYLDAILTVDAKSFKAEVSIIQNKYLCWNPEKWSTLYISGKMIKKFNNMFEDETWEQELGEKDQIIALSTKVAKLQLKLNKQVIALATQEKKEVTPDAGVGSGSSCRSKRDGPYTVPAWHLIKKEDKVIDNEKNTIGALEIITAVMLNTAGCMLITRLVICDHDAWRSKIDERHTSRNKDKESNETPSNPSNDLNQKLTFNNKLCNAFCTQAGLFAEAVDRIWEDGQGNE
jgi:hypothetical protein